MRLERGRSPLTIERYKTTLRAFERFLADEYGDGEFDLQEVQKPQLVAFLKQKTGTEEGEPSRSNWNMRLASLRALYHFLFKEELIDVNPALRIDRLRNAPREPSPLSLDEMLRLLDAAEQGPVNARLRNTLIIKVLFHCALRVAELVSLDIDQVDTENRLLLNVRIKRGKRVSVSYNDIVAEALEDYLPTRHAANAAAGTNALLLSGRGNRLSVRRVQEMVKRYARNAGISRPVTPHLLRHSSVTQLVQLGTPLRVVQELLGHSSIRTTQRYAAVNSEQRRSASDALAKAWNKKSQAKMETKFSEDTTTSKNVV